MKKLVLTTAYLPPVEYFAAMLSADKIVIENDESYSKQSYRNRCEIMGPNGKQSLTLPVRKKDKASTHITNMHLMYVEDWGKLHWKSLETAYNSSPFFFYYRDELIAFYEQEFDRLIDFNTSLLQLLLDIYQIEKEIEFTNEFCKTYHDALDLRFTVHPKLPDIIPDPPVYMQVFDERYGFMANLSIIDLLFNKGPESLLYVMELAKNFENKYP